MIVLKKQRRKRYVSEASVQIEEQERTYHHFSAQQGG